MKVALVGLGSDETHVPWDDDTWTIWGLNGAHRRPNFFMRPNGDLRADAWFQIHPPFACDKSELDWLRLVNENVECTVPTYVLPADLPYWSATYPSAAECGLFLPYPVDEVRERFPTGWLANTFCLQAALAIMQGATALGFFGIECTSYGREVAVERPAVMWWQGYATACGIEVLVDSAVGPYPQIYGVEFWQEARRAAEITEMILPHQELFEGVNLDTVAAVDAAENKVRQSVPDRT